MRDRQRPSREVARKLSSPGTCPSGRGPILGCILRTRFGIGFVQNIFTCYNSILRCSILGWHVGDFLSDGAFLIKYTRMLVSAGLIAVCSVDARAQTVGDWVLGNYQGAGYWFPGVVEKIGADKVTIRYDDGDRETVAVGAVRPYDWTTTRARETGIRARSPRWLAKRSGSPMTTATRRQQKLAAAVRIDDDRAGQQQAKHCLKWRAGPHGPVPLRPDLCPQMRAEIGTSQKIRILKREVVGERGRRATWAA